MITRPTAIALAALAVACGGSFPAPTQRMADAESAQRAAQELGAASVPAAQLHVKLADEEVTKAKMAMNDGDNKSADALLARAKADSELALALAREEAAKRDLQSAQEKANATATINDAQGAKK